MRFKETPLPGSYCITLDKKGDDRGFFARVFCQNEFAEYGLDTNIVQINNSLSKHKGTLRGMHYQLPPKVETKIVRCIQGRLWDVMLDLRPDSSTFGQWYGEDLTAENRKMLYIPKGFAHGFITLEDNTEILYLVTEFYAHDHERTVLWNDPKFGIEWPMTPTVISDKDRKAPGFNSAHHLNK